VAVASAGPYAILHFAPDRQTMYRNYRRENREKNGYKRDIETLEKSQKNAKSEYYHLTLDYTY